MVYIKRARRPLEGRQRPFFGELPQEKLSWPAVRQRPTPPTAPSIWMYLPTLLFPLLTGIGSLLFQPNPSIRSVLPYLISGLGMGVLYPAFQRWGYRQQVRAYERELQYRYQEFKKGIEELDRRAEDLAQIQKRVLNRRYPKASSVCNIVFKRENWRRRLWIRGQFEEDFLVLRIGTGTGKPSFYFDDSLPFARGTEKELEGLVEETLRKWRTINDVPITVSLRESQSILIRGTRNDARSVAHRLFLDLMVHHSPRLVRLGLIVQGPGFVREAWKWTKWVPHTYALEDPDDNLLAFDEENAYELIDFLKQRTEEQANQADDSVEYNEAIVVFFDDMSLRTHPDVAFIVNHGHAAGIYTIFVGDETTPKYPTNTELRIEGKRFVLKTQVKVDDGDKEKVRTIRQEGRIEEVSITDLGRIARILASIEPPEPLHGTSDLPTLVSLADLFEKVCETLSQDESQYGNESLFSSIKNTDLLYDPETVLTDRIITEIWKTFSTHLKKPDSSAYFAILRHLINFPVGLTIKGNKLEPVFLNLLPEGSKWGGYAAYHTILIGPTGSGKSEFIKALIWSGAYLYPPNVLNVFFIDFKGGAALEDLKYRYQDESGQEHEMLLPHIVGLVTNPGLVGDQELSGEAVARRGIYCLRRELDRRMETITKKGKSKDIWEYNRKFPDTPLPHLLIILDEFSKALQDFPELHEVLENLVRLGRSLGMYLLLANQDVTQAVTQLLTNVGWRIALRMGGGDLRTVVGRSLPDLTQVGRGYLMCVPTNEIAVFQSPYGGIPLHKDSKEFAIYDITVPGRREILTNFKINGHGENQDTGKGAQRTQGRILSEMICRVVLNSKEYSPPRHVYLEPLPAHIPLLELLQESGEPLAFRDGMWITEQGRTDSWQVPIGRMDDLRNVQYQILRFAIDEEDGHLWIMGVQTSGREKVVEAIVGSLSHRYTPEEIYIYVLDFGSGVLRHLKNLPHMGTYVDVSEEEKRYRLFRFLQSVYSERKGGAKVRIPRIMLVLYDFHFRSAMDLLEEEEYRLIHTFAKDGGNFGIHLIFVTSTALSLRDELAGNLSRRYILELPQREDYWDAGLPRGELLPLTRRVPGRGYWVTGRGDNLQVHEAQAAQVPWRQFLVEMAHTWEGKKPPKFELLPLCLSKSSWLERVSRNTKKYEDRSMIFPIGLDFEEYKPIQVNLEEEPPVWLITGPSKRGKTNFLLLWAYEALQKSFPNEPEITPWEIWYVGMKPLPEDAHELNESPRFRAFIGEENQLLAWEELQSRLSELDTRTKLLLLIDDGDEVLPSLPDSSELKTASRNRKLYVLLSVKKASGTLMKLGYGTFARSLLQQCQDERIGLALDDRGLSDFFNMTPRSIKSIWIKVWKQSKNGRGVFVHRGKPYLVQIPLIGSCQ